MKLIFKTLDWIAPSFSAKKVYQFMSNPRVRKLRDFEEKILAQAKQKQEVFKNFQIQNYVWGEADKPKVMLIHGWEGQVGNFGNLISLLLEKGFQVIGYDGPSHGKSSQYNTNMFEYAEFITEKIVHHQPDVVISHSFGSITTLIGMHRNPKIHLKQWFAVTTPFDFKDRINQVKEMLGVTDRTVNKLIHLLEQDTEYSVDDLNIEASAHEIQNIEECIIIHSEHDKVLPIDDSRKAQKHLQNAELIELQDLGHYKILWSDELKDIIAKRLK